MLRLLPSIACLLLAACSAGESSSPAPTATNLPTATVLAFSRPATATPAPSPTPTPLPDGIERVTIAASRDTSIFENDEAEISNGIGDGLFVGRNRAGRAARSLVYFDVAAAVPAGAQILSAELTMRSSRAATGNATITLHAIEGEWGEANSAGTRGGGTGAPAQPGDATWTHREYPDEAWLVPGGDFGTGQAETQFGEVVATYVWGPAAAMTQQVQAWLDDPASNPGWLLRTLEEPDRITAVRFYSREGGSDRSGPLLVITYTES